MTVTTTLSAQTGWAPSAGQPARQLRAQLNALVRRFFEQRGVLEVETPLLSAAANPDPAITSLATEGLERRYLRTSPEFPLKRLVAAGAGPVYELGRVFRAGERGRHHNCEFTMLEWYRPGFELDELIEEVADLVGAALALGGRTTRRASLTWEALLTRHFEQALPVDEAGWLDLARRRCQASPGLNQTACMDLAFSQASAALAPDALTFVTEFPASQCALARLDPANPAVARRFEAFLGAIELANGYDELTCAETLQQRLSDDNAARHASGQQMLPFDHHLLAAHERGLPPSCGVSVGIDRLLMATGGYQHIDEVLNFPDAVA